MLLFCRALHRIEVTEIFIVSTTATQQEQSKFSFDIHLRFIRIAPTCSLICSPIIKSYSNALEMNKSCGRRTLEHAGAREQIFWEKDSYRSNVIGSYLAKHLSYSWALLGETELRFWTCNSRSRKMIDTLRQTVSQFVVNF